MNLNFKLFFKYILLNTNNIFIKFLYNNDKNVYIYTNNSYFYYLILHLKLSSFFYSSQLIDIFSYELPSPKNTKISNKEISVQNPQILVYNFHSVLNQKRFFIFYSNENNLKNVSKYNKISNSPLSTAELFSNANWLERELSELHGFFFGGKKDTRNLMLQYGDTTAPMKKSFPSIGLREIFYDSTTDFLIQNPVSIQF